MVIPPLGCSRGQRQALRYYVTLLNGNALPADTPYYGGFGPGFLHLNFDGTYGKGEIRSGDLRLEILRSAVWRPLQLCNVCAAWQGGMVGRPCRQPQIGPADHLFAALPHVPIRVSSTSEIPLQTKMEAFAPWIPGDSKLSSLPVLFFDFQVTNPDPSEKTVAIAFTIPNPDCDGGKPVDGRTARLPEPSSSRSGQAAAHFADCAKRWRCPDELGRRFYDKGTLARAPCTHGRGRPETCIASSIVLAGKATRHIVFVFAWDFPVYISGDGKKWPRKELGHYHNNFYHSADDNRPGLPRQLCRSIRPACEAWFDRMWGKRIARMDAAANPRQYFPHGVQRRLLQERICRHQGGQRF